MFWSNLDSVIILLLCALAWHSRRKAQKAVQLLQIEMRQRFMRQFYAWRLRQYLVLAGLMLAPVLIFQFPHWPPAILWGMAIGEFIACVLYFSIGYAIIEDRIKAITQNAAFASQHLQDRYPMGILYISLTFMAIRSSHLPLPF
ncbi:MAG: hypothetical protein KDK39_01070 [Leptospiraceae bacterium]|nr:hypothetical protein [Leptospiraceae bacterium]